MEGSIGFASETSRRAEALLRSGMFEDAARLYEDILHAGFDGYGQRVNYAQCLKRLGSWHGAIEQFKVAFRIRRGTPGAAKPGADQPNAGPLSTFYVHHLSEQLAHLASAGVNGAFSTAELDGVNRVHRFLNDCYGRNAAGVVPPDLTAPVAGLLAGCAHYAPQPGVDPAISPAAKLQRIDLGVEGSPVYVIDDVFDAPTLAALRTFLVDSTIWYDARPERGYLGAHLHDGLACRLVEKTAEAARGLATPLIGDTLISQVWAFKYAPRAAGIDLHADQASWNVNMWLTDEASNQNPEGGGMTIYGCEAPADWKFEMYNASPARVRDYLASSGAPSRRVEYRSNRAILFNSRLFHKTDPVDFSPDYPGRRINMTVMLDKLA